MSHAPLSVKRRAGAHFELPAVRIILAILEGIEPPTSLVDLLFLWGRRRSYPGGYVILSYPAASVFFWEIHVP